MPDQTTTTLEILMIEDNPGDVRLIREALREARVASHVHVLSDGGAAQAFLADVESLGTRPDVILLDLDLPRVHGRDILVAIRSDPVLRDIPVVVLTSSSAEDDARRSLELDADHYVTKPMELEAYVALARRLGSFTRRAGDRPT